MTAADAAEISTASEPIVAKAGSYYRNMRYLMCAVLIVMGLWFAYDGFTNYPNQNKQILALKEQRDQAERAQNQPLSNQLLNQMNAIHQGRLHTDADLLLQRALGLGLPPLGVLVVVWAIYNSRGEYRLERHTLHVPGHPPIPLLRITDVDRRLWDRKGIAYVRYELENGKSGKARLDDFVYDRKPTDAIYDKLPSGGSTEPPAGEAILPSVDPTEPAV